MNKIFKVIWDHSAQTFVVVSELARTKGKTKAISKQRGIKSLILLSVGTMATSMLQAATTTTTAQLGGVAISTKEMKTTEYTTDSFVKAGQLAVAMGHNVSAGTAGTAIGSNSTAADGAFVLGAEANGTSFGSVAIGYRAQATGSDEYQRIAIGSRSLASGAQNSMALGVNTTASGTNAQAVGMQSVASGEGAIAFGSANATASGNFSAAIGNQANATAQASSAFGVNANAKGTSSTALGAASKAEGEGSSSLGVSSNASGYASTALGAMSNAIGANATALGSFNTINGANSTGVGNNNNVTGNNTFVLGSNVQAQDSGSVILGNSSSGEGSNQIETITQVTVGTITYSPFAGVANTPGSYVSIGSKGNERKLINLAAGNISVTSTEAVNGSQLYSVMVRIEKQAWKLNVLNTTGGKSNTNGETISVGNDQTVTLVAGQNIELSQDQRKVMIKTVSNPTFETVNLSKGDNTINLTPTEKGLNVSKADGSSAKIDNVAEGNITKDSKQAVNGSQLYQTIETLTTKGLSFTGDNESKVVHKKLGDTLSIVGNLDDDEPVTDENLRVDAENGKLVLKMAKSLTDLTNATFTNGNVKTVVGDNGVTVTNVANPNQTPVRLTEKGLDNGNNVITNVSAGVNPTDAVNVSQLEAVNSTVNSGWKLSTNGDAGNASTVNPVTNRVDLSNTDGNINISQNGNNVVFNLNPNTTFGGNGKDGEIGVKGADGKTGVTLNGKDGSIGINGKDGKDASITVAEGKTTVDPKDGQNGITRVVYETTRPVLDENGNPKKDANGNPITKTVTRQVATMDDGLVFAGDKGETAQKLGTKLTVMGGETDSSKLSDKPNIGVIAKDGKLSVQLAKNINLGDNSKVQTGNVSISSDGINAGGKKVSNIADGELSPNSKDAVNGSQLHATNQNVSKVQNEVAKGWNVQADKVANTNGQVVNGKKANVKMGDTVSVKASNNIRVTQDGKNLEIATVPNPTFNSVTTGGLNVAPNSVVNMGGNRVQNVADGKYPTDAVNVRQLKGVENRLNNENKKLRGGIASAAATGLIPQAFIPGKSLVAASATTYRGSNAVAVGYSRASDNGKVLLKVAGSANTQGNVLGGVSLGYQW